MAEFQQVLWAHVRRAELRDAPHVLALIQQLADFERLSEMCVATVPKLESSLFRHSSGSKPFFAGPSVLLLEVSNNPPDEKKKKKQQQKKKIPAMDHGGFPSDGDKIPEPNLSACQDAGTLSEKNPDGDKIPEPNLSACQDAATLAEKNPEEDLVVEKEADPDPFPEISREFELRSPIKDSHALSFRSSEDRIVAGFVLFFPNYSTFLAKPGFYIEDLYVRECFRGRGFGSLLLRTVAKLAVQLGYGRVEWCVLDWNVNAIKFYEGIGAKVMQEWRICRLTGEALDTCASQS